MRMMLLPLLVLFFSAMCLGQTFQYSNGWLPGKRALTGSMAHYPRDDNTLPELFDFPQDGDRKLERCLLQLQHFLRNPLQFRAPVSSGNNNMNGNNKNNPLSNHHQSNELYEELNPAEVNDYGKH